MSDGTPRTFNDFILKNKEAAQQGNSIAITTKWEASLIVGEGDIEIQVENNFPGEAQLFVAGLDRDDEDGNDATVWLSISSPEELDRLATLFRTAADYCRSKMREAGQ